MNSRFSRGALAAALALALTSASAFAEGPDPDRVWIQFKPGAKGQVQNALRAAGARFHHSFDELNAFAVSLPPQALRGIQNNPNVLLVEPDAPRYPMAQVRPYGIDMVQAPQVWAAGHTGQGITVCVIDSGVHSAHADFQGVNLVGGHPASWGTDTCGHGSHVTGTIAAADNGTGVVGVNTGGINIFTVKVFDGASCGWSYSSTLVDAANRCANAGAKVINMSLGGGTSSTTENNAFNNLYNQGVLSIAAAGNGGNTRLSYPASYNSVVSVAAIDQNKAHASFSQRNSQVELAAPGVGVLSTVPFEDGAFSVGGTGYIVTSFEGTVRTTAGGNLVDGGLCTGTGNWAGRVVLCERGEISFADKVANAALGGAVGVAIYNNVAGGFSGTLGSGTSAIPAVSMSREDGLSARGRVGQSATVSTLVNSQGNGYAYYDGTSMASPHVAGVAALVWSANPTWTAAQIREALAVTAEDLGASGRDTSFGWGLVRAKAALDYLTGQGGGGDPDPDPTEVVARVGNIALSTSQKGPNLSTTATATIVNQAGAAIGGASVTGCFSGAVARCSTATTNAAGQASFSSGNYRSGSLTFCVTNVTGPNDSFDSSNACRTL